MADSMNTCWTMIRDAAEGGDTERTAFSLRYEPVIRAYLGARWRNSRLCQEIDDACQDFFLECFREGGALHRVRSGMDGGFRAFLFGIARNIALRWEQRMGRERARPVDREIDLGEIATEDPSLSKIFDRAWASAVLQEAAERQSSNARIAGPEAIKRVELLELRFREGRPIREIAELWNADPTQLHREYAKARNEFTSALRDVVSFHHPDAGSAELQQRCTELLGMLGQ